MTTLETLREEFALTTFEFDAMAQFDTLLLETATHTNLVSKATLNDRFERHYRDSLQLYDLIPKGSSTLLDIGSGAGFPGMVLGILSHTRVPDRRLTLCDSVKKKASFLESVARHLSLANVDITSERAEALSGTFEVVTARAVANLTRLLPIVHTRLKPDGVAILPKGRSGEIELEEAEKEWRMHAERAKSHTDPDATIFSIRRIKPR